MVAELIGQYAEKNIRFHLIFSQPVYNQQKN